MKKFMKKMIGLLCLMTLLASMMTGCGQNSSKAEPTDTKTETSTQTDDGTDNTTTEDTADTTADSDTADTENTANTEDTTAYEDVDLGQNEDVPELEGYTLLWNDEFNGDTLDETKWTRELRDPGWTNAELQAYVASDENIYVHNGKLTLRAIKYQDENGKDAYTSGKVNSQNKQDFMYGKVVARAKVPTGKGLWPAIWMMPQDESFYGQWPKCGEIDIMEVLGDQTELAYQTIHYGEPHGEQQGTKKLEGTTFADDFHDYSVEWEPGEIRYYIDDELILTVNDWYTAEEGELWKEYPAPFNQPFFVQMNLAVGGTWPGNPTPETDFENAKFEIDYVRVYQKPEYDTNVKRPKKVFRKADKNGNFIHNGDFSVAEDLTDEEDWNFLLFAEGEGTAEIKDGMITITSENAGTENHSVQLVQREMPMKNGHKYRLSFDAIAYDRDRNFKVCVSAPNVGWIRYLPDTSVRVTTEWQTFTYEFEMTQNDDNLGRVEFNLGNTFPRSTVSITNVVLEEIK